MKTIGAHEAKTHLSRLLDEVACGAQVTITRHDVPVARLVPAGVASPADPIETLRALREFRDKHSLGDLSLRKFTDEGRRQ